MRMRLAKWLRFQWELDTEANPPPLELPEHYDVRPAVKGELPMVKSLVLNAFSLDNDWSDVLADLKNLLTSAVERSLDGKQTTALLLCHGNRAVGASIVTTTPDLPESLPGCLLTGPVVLSEYRNRGWGSLLLQASLIHLRDSGITSASAVTKLNSTAAKFVYPKFGGSSEPHQFEPLPED